MAKAEAAARVTDGEIQALKRRFGLTTGEAKTVMMMWRTGGRPLQTWAMAQEVCGSNIADPDNCMKVLISRARKKMGRGYIVLSHGIGYFLPQIGMDLVTQTIRPAIQSWEEILPDNDEPTALENAAAIVLGRLAGISTVERARAVMINVSAALDRQYGPAS